jgi:hypothetical protein
MNRKILIEANLGQKAKIKLQKYRAKVKSFAF